MRAWYWLSEGSPGGELNQRSESLEKHCSEKRGRLQSAILALVEKPAHHSFIPYECMLPFPFCSPPAPEN